MQERGGAPDRGSNVTVAVTLPPSRRTVLSSTSGQSLSGSPSGSSLAPHSSHSPPNSRISVVWLSVYPCCPRGNRGLRAARNSTSPPASMMASANSASVKWPKFGHLNTTPPSPKYANLTYLRLDALNLSEVE